VLCHTPMRCFMLFRAFTQIYILWTVIFFITFYVMYLFFPCWQPSIFLFNYQSVFKHVTLFICSFMARHPNTYITITFTDAPAFPHVMIFTSTLSNFYSISA